MRHGLYEFTRLLIDLNRRICVIRVFCLILYSFTHYYYMRMKSCLDFILPLFLLWGITACSAPADKDMLEYEYSLAHADSLVQSGVADSARTVRLLSGLHREYARVKEQSAGKPLRLMPVTGWKHTLWGVFGALMLGLNVWLSIRDIKFTNERKHRRYLINLSENERHLHNNECERAELEECLKEMSLEDDEREEVQRSLVNLMTRGGRLHEENGVLRGRLREYEDHPVPYELELLQKRVNVPVNWTDRYKRSPPH